MNQLSILSKICISLVTKGMLKFYRKVDIKMQGNF